MNEQPPPKGGENDDYHVKWRQLEHPEDAVIEALEQRPHEIEEELAIVAQPFQCRICPRIESVREARAFHVEPLL
jgi:hypothetical protein